MTGERLREKADERVRMSRAEQWLLRIAAATGVVGAITHGVELARSLGL